VSQFSIPLGICHGEEYYPRSCGLVALQALWCRRFNAVQPDFPYRVREGPAQRRSDEAMAGPTVDLSGPSSPPSR